MADATPSAPRSFQAFKPSTPQVAIYPSPTLGKPFGASESRAARAAAHTKRQAWAAMDLRQEWADEAFMRGHLRAAGLRVNVSTEPATVNRIKAKLRSIGVQSPEIQEALGMPLGRWLSVNPKMPLWAALALVLESVGRFTPGADDQAPDTAAPASSGTTPPKVLGAPAPPPPPVIRVAMPTQRRPFVVAQGGRE